LTKVAYSEESIMAVALLQLPTSRCREDRSSADYADYTARQNRNRAISWRLRGGGTDHYTEGVR
jgi:hypothetical protein